MTVLTGLLDMARTYVVGVPGIGPVTLGGAVPRYQTWAAAGAVDGGTYSYGITDANNQQENGVCVYSAAGPSITRTPVFSTAAGNAPIQVTSQAQVYFTLLKEGFPAGGVTTVDTGVGLSGGPITVTGTVTLDPATALALGGVVIGGGVTVNPGGTISVSPGGVTTVDTGPGLSGGPITNVGTLTLEPASTADIGGVIIGTGITVTPDGTISVGAATGSFVQTETGSTSEPISGMATLANPPLADVLVPAVVAGDTINYLSSISTLLTAPNAPASSGQGGGTIVVTGGDGDGAGHGGLVNIVAGGGPNTGGVVTVAGGRVTTSGTAGIAAVFGGQNFGIGAGGSVQVFGGNARGLNTADVGGSVLITGGEVGSGGSSATLGVAGGVTITGGFGVGSSNAGGVLIQGGNAHSGSGADVTISGGQRQAGGSFGHVLVNNLPNTDPLTAGVLWLLNGYVVETGAVRGAGGVTSIVAGLGLAGGTITTTGTVTLDVATTAALGGLIVGSGATINAGGTLSVAAPGTGTVRSIVVGTGLGGGTITGTGTITNTGVLAVGATAGSIVLGSMLAMTGATLNTTGFGSMALENSNSVSITGGTITGMPTPSGSTDVANKAYVDSVAAGLNPAVAVQAATAAILPNSPTYNNGAAGIGAFITTTTLNTALVIDGQTINTLGQRVLVKNEGSGGGLGAPDNGVYTLTQIVGLAAAWILTRALDYDQPSDMNNTGAIPVVNGTVNAQTSWVLTSQIATVGTDPLTFTQYTLNPTTIVQGPASAINGHLAVFNGTSGKLIADGGAPVAGSVTFLLATTGANAAFILKGIK